MLRRVEAAPAGAGNALASSAATSGKKRPAWRDGEILVRFRQGISEQDKNSLVASKSAERGRKLRGKSGLEKLRLAAGRDPQAVAAELRQDPMIEIAEPNYLISRDEIVPNDPQFGEQWALRNTGQNGGQVGADVNAAMAWETTTGSTSTIIAVIDSGIDFTHPDLLNNQWTNTAEQADGVDDDHNGLVDDLHGWDWVADSNQIKDAQGHGTSVAGLIAAEGNNGNGTTGVMWRAGLMSLRVLDSAGSGTTADAVVAIDYAIAHGAKVINCSWGTDAESLILKEAIERAAAQQALVVSSAGNSARDIDSTPYYPASFGLPNVVSVAATTNLNQLTSSSNWGAASVTLAAPGAGVLTTQLGGGYRQVTGTSASTAVVSGVAGLIKTMRPLLGAADTKAALVNGSRQVAELAGKTSAASVVSAPGALGNMQGPDVQPSESPTPTPTPDATPSPSPTPEDGQGGGGGDTGGPDPEIVQPDPPGQTGAPGANLPDLAAERNEEPVEPQAPELIQADLPCDVCGGGEPPPGGSIDDPDMGGPRTDPINETGTPHVDLGSRNYNWALPVVGLPGRAGLDLNLALVYNSLVWTKSGSRIRYNADRGFPGPGFRLGWPILQKMYKNARGVDAYLMVTPSGGRIEMERVGTTSTFESTDSTYTQLTDNGTAGAVVRATDGTQLTFVRSTSGVAVPDGEMRCVEIKDRNGNYLTASYNTSGRLTTITDTLGREIVLTADTSGRLQYVRQRLKSGLLRRLATFTYESLTIQTNFPGLIIEGPLNGTMINVPARVEMLDGTRYDFAYTSWGQVWKISRSTPDDEDPSVYRVRSYTSYNLPQTNAAAETDCPRFNEERTWAQDWNGDTDGVAASTEEAVTSYQVDPNGAWTKVYTPDGTVHVEQFATSGWRKGLTTGTETWIPGAIKVRGTTIVWTQDDETLSYQKNPRVVDSIIDDNEGNRRRTTTTYYPTSSYSLPMDIREYAANGTTVLRTTHYDYLLTDAYTSRRIIGLVNFEIVRAGDTTAPEVAKVKYQYDEAGMLVDEGTEATAVQHDGTNYPATFIAGRGNRTSVRRYNAPNADFVEYNTTYNSTGSVVSTRDPRAHKTTISYRDKYFVSTTAAAEDRNTWAYPTTVTDADNYSSRAEYDFDLGAPEKTFTPSSGTGTAVTEVRMLMSYDSAGRVTKATNLENNSYTRFVYDPSLMLVKSYHTVTGPWAGNEVYSAKKFDGAGRVRGTSTEHISTDHTASQGGYSGQYFEYDKMGRLWKQSNPTEMTEGWVATGDDSTGWRYTIQTYDWKGRPLETTNPDNTKRSIEYDGCGCAGGEVTVITDERGRQRKLTTDILGRLAQVDEMNFEVNGSRSVYATTTYTYDALDHLTVISQGSGTTARTRTFDYDGHGRLIKRTTPEQGETTYTYNADDTVSVVRDALDSTTTLTYNNRHMVTGISYGEATSQDVAVTPNVTFGYDGAGNRTSMTDGQGSVNYTYNDLGQLTAEARSFTGLSGSTFTLGYTYNVGGELTKITSSLGPQVGYVYDRTGQLTKVTGAGYAGVAEYVRNITYRAFGGFKSVEYSNDKSLDVTYTSRLRVKQWNVPGVMGWTYYYGYFGENTGRVTYAQSLNSGTLNRSYEYDQVGRLIESQTGSDARYHAGVTTTPGTGDGPYAQTYSYDKWGNMTSRQGRGGADYVPYSGTFSTRNQRQGHSFDAAGSLKTAGAWTYIYDATGQQREARENNVLKLTQSYDGNRMRVKKDEEGVKTYYLRSSVLGGQVIAEIDGTGQMKRGYVYMGGQMIALQDTDTEVAGGVQQVSWVHQDPVTKSQRFTDGKGTMLANKVDLDPWGIETEVSANSEKQPHRFTTYERDANGSDEAMMRRYSSRRSRFDQPDPWDGSYDLSDPQSMNRYAYVQNDPVNFVDPSGLEDSWNCGPQFSSCNGMYDAAHSGYDPFYDGPSSPFIREGMDRYERWKSGYLDRRALEKLGITVNYGEIARVTVYIGFGWSVNQIASQAVLALRLQRGGYGESRPAVPRVEPKDNDNFKRLNISFSPSLLKGYGVGFSFTWDKYGRNYFSVGPTVGLGLPVSVSIQTGQTYLGGKQVHDAGSVRDVLTGWSQSINLCGGPCVNGAMTTTRSGLLLWPSGGGTFSAGFGIPDASYTPSYTWEY